MGLVSRGAAEAGLGTASAAVRPGPPDAVPNPIPTPPAEGADPGAAGEQSGGGPASLRRDLGEPPPPGYGSRLLPRRPREQAREPEGLRSLLPEAAQAFCLSEPLFPHL